MDSSTQDISNMLLNINQKMDTLEGRLTLVEINHQKHVKNCYKLLDSLSPIKKELHVQMKETSSRG